jgi:hypothetical protein
LCHEIIVLEKNESETKINKVIITRKHRGQLNPLISFENAGTEDFSHFKQSRLDCFIPTWSAAIQVNMDVSGGILANLDAGYPGRHDLLSHFHSLRGEP